MDRYVLPPFMDFRASETFAPYVMYFFEFNAELDSTDLSNIWQNLYPESPESTASPRYSRLWMGDPSRDDVSYSSHILDSTIVHAIEGTDESINLSNYKVPDAFLGSEVRWIVFKCKYRAKSDFTFVKNESIDLASYFESKTNAINARPAVRTRGGTRSSPEAMRYNWPYDYFSFVELIKLESKVDFYSIGQVPKTPNQG